MKFSGIIYYLRSIPVLLAGIKSWGVVLGLVGKGSNGPRKIVSLRDGSRFEIKTLMDVWVLKETCLDRQYETFGVPIHDGWVVMDIGGGWGDFAISVARRNPHCRVAAFEPFPPSIEMFQKNIALNKVQNVWLVTAAVGKTSGKMKLFTSNAEAVQLSTAQSATDLFLEVESLTLADALDSQGIARCDFLKMDCEGGEYDILFSASPETISRIKRICMETHDGVTRHSHVDLIAFLQNLGYRVKFEVNPVHPDLGMLYAQREP